MTALMVTSVRGHTTTMRNLLEAGANLNAEDWVRHLESEKHKHAEMVEGNDEEEGMSVKAPHLTLPVLLHVLKGGARVLFLDSSLRDHF